MFSDSEVTYEKCDAFQSVGRKGKKAKNHPKKPANVIKHLCSDPTCPLLFDYLKYKNSILPKETHVCFEVIRKRPNVKVKWMIKPGEYCFDVDCPNLQWHFAKKLQRIRDASRKNRAAERERKVQVGVNQKPVVENIHSRLKNIEAAEHGRPVKRKAPRIPLSLMKYLGEPKDKVPTVVRNKKRVVKPKVVAWKNHRLRHQPPRVAKGGVIIRSTGIEEKVSGKRSLEEDQNVSTKNPSSSQGISKSGIQLDRNSSSYRDIEVRRLDSFRTCKDKASDEGAIPVEQYSLPAPEDEIRPYSSEDGAPQGKSNQFPTSDDTTGTYQSTINIGDVGIRPLQTTPLLDSDEDQSVPENCQANPFSTVRDLIRSGTSYLFSRCQDEPCQFNLSPACDDETQNDQPYLRFRQSFCDDRVLSDALEAFGDETPLHRSSSFQVYRNGVLPDQSSEQRNAENECPQVNDEDTSVPDDFSDYHNMFF